MMELASVDPARGHPQGAVKMLPVEEPQEERTWATAADRR